MSQNKVLLRQTGIDQPTARRCKFRTLPSASADTKRAGAGLIEGSGCAPGSSSSQYRRVHGSGVECRAVSVSGDVHGGQAVFVGCGCVSGGEVWLSWRLPVVAPILKASVAGVNRLTCCLSVVDLPVMDSLSGSFLFLLCVARSETRLP